MARFTSIRQPNIPPGVTDMPELCRQLQRPLGRPPSGEWQKHDDGSWSVAAAGGVEPLPPSATAVSKATARPRPSAGRADGDGDDEPTVVEHVVQPTDTLAGLCLRYKTKVRER